MLHQASTSKQAAKPYNPLPPAIRRRQQQNKTIAVAVRDGNLDMERDLSFDISSNAGRSISTTASTLQREASSFTSENTKLSSMMLSHQASISSSLYQPYNPLPKHVAKMHRKKKMSASMDKNTFD
jgi:hypothetical protein